MVIQTASAIFVGLIVSLVLYVSVIYVSVRLPRNFILRFILVVPICCAPVVTGFALTMWFANVVHLDTPDERSRFFLIWAFLASIGVFVSFAKRDRMQKVSKKDE
jgi:ABC-type Fe3+ transport system permease subunit